MIAAALALLVVTACSPEADTPTPVPTVSPVPDTQATITARVNATVEALPTPTPTNTPEPTATSTPTPTPEPTATPTPTPMLTPTPTPHPCSLAGIGPADELQLVYTRYLAADPNYSGMTPLAREWLDNQFQDIAAAYIIEFTANPAKYASFRDYLRVVGSRAFDADIPAGFRALQDLDLLPSAGESLYEYNQRRASDPCTPARSRIFADDGSMTLLAVGYRISIISPILRGGVVNLTIREINAFRFNDLTTPLIYWILEELVE